MGLSGREGSCLDRPDDRSNSSPRSKRPSISRRTAWWPISDGCSTSCCATPAVRPISMPTGWRRSSAPDDSIDWDRWTEIPILTRAEAQENTGAVEGADVPRSRRSRSHARRRPPARPAAPSSTFPSHLQRIGTACANERFFHWHGLDPSRLAAFIRATPKAVPPIPTGASTRAGASAIPESPGAELAIDTPIDGQIEWLRRIEPSIPYHLSEQPARDRTTDRRKRAPLRFHALADHRRNDLCRTCRRHPRRLRP